MKTRNGLEARIYASDGGGTFPVHGAVLIQDTWKPCQWTLEGHAFTGGESELDIVDFR